MLTLSYVGVHPWPYSFTTSRVALKVNRSGSRMRSRARIRPTPQKPHACHHLLIGELVKCTWNREVNLFSSFINKLNPFGCKQMLQRFKERRAGNVCGIEINKNIFWGTASQFWVSCWQIWVRQLGFSIGPLWHSFSPPFPVWLSFDCIRMSVLLLTPAQEVFGSSVVSCPECYRESSSDDQPASLLFAASPCGSKRKKGTGGFIIKNQKKWTNITKAKAKVQVSHFITSEHTLLLAVKATDLASPWQSPIKWLPESMLTKWEQSKW